MKNEMVGVEKRHFWNWTNDGAERVLHLNGTIAPESWFEDDVTPDMFRSELNAGTGPITIWINSPGGDCVCASQIYTMLMDYPYDVTVKINGIAASAASVIAMAGTTVLMAPTALMMCHNPSTVAMGDHGEMERAIEMLDAVKESIINAYEIKTGLPRKELSKMMDSETWMDATKAIELGFADGILEREVQPITDVSAPVLFSQKAVDAALMNKVKQSAGIPIKPFYDRLNQLR